MQLWPEDMHYAECDSEITNYSWVPRQIFISACVLVCIPSCMCVCVGEGQICLHVCMHAFKFVNTSVYVHSRLETEQKALHLVCLLWSHFLMRRLREAVVPLGQSL